MTDLDRNIRTLVVCFVVAVLGMVSLSLFGGIGDQVVNSRILGESVVISSEKVKLPDTDFSVGRLESPYDVIDGLSNGNGI